MANFIYTLFAYFRFDSVKYLLKDILIIAKYCLKFASNIISLKDYGALTVLNKGILLFIKLAFIWAGQVLRINMYNCMTGSSL